MKIVALAGRMNTGKDSAGLILAEKGWQRVALADVLKQWCHRLFGFDRETLFGPSELRNRIVPYGEVNWEAVFYRAGRMLETVWLTFVSSHGTTGARLTQDDVSIPFFEFLSDCQSAAQEGRFSARYALQKLGTEFGRKLYDGVWLDHLMLVASELDGHHPYDEMLGIQWNTYSPDYEPAGIYVTDCRFPNEAEYLRARGGKVYWIDADRRVPTPENRHASEPLASDFDGLLDGVIDNNGPLENLRAEVERVVTDEG